MRPARAVLLVTIAALAACSSVRPQYEPRVHVVKRGETLYTIAWRYGMDHRTLARWNDISNPDLIFVGQRIRIAPQQAASRSRSARSSGQPSRPGSVSPSPASDSGSASRRAAAPARPAAERAAPVPGWQWPTQGRVVSAFGSSADIASGIGIAGRAGQPVRAAAAGRVVYAGTGLIGYGQLVIIKHNETYLSAYGHNSRLLVEQGQQVRRGETIAEMGLGPERSARLHFEIRRDGMPVDPMRYFGS